MARILSTQFGRSIRYVDCPPPTCLQCAQAAGVDAWLAHDNGGVADGGAGWPVRHRARHGGAAQGRAPRRFEAFANELATSLRYANAPERATRVRGRPA